MRTCVGAPRKREVLRPVREPLLIGFTLDGAPGGEPTHLSGSLLDAEAQIRGGGGWGHVDGGLGSAHDGVPLVAGSIHKAPHR